MVVRNTERMEVRLDAESREFLRCLLAERSLTFADWVREKMKEERAAEARREAMAAARRLSSLNEDWVPDDPDELRRMIDDEDLD